MKRLWLLMVYLAVVAITATSGSCINGSGNGDIASVRKIYVGGAWNYSGGLINIELKPTKMAIANTNYKVQLYEKGKLRDSSSVVWNTSEINAASPKIITFRCSYEEWKIYQPKGDVRKIFSVTVTQ
jgi:hypothetical protein